MSHPIQELDEASLEYCTNILSASSLALFVGHYLVTRQACSVVRMGDGERKIIRVALGEESIDSFLADENWLAELGLTDADLPKVGEDLIRAGNLATCFCPSISGIWNRGYRMFEYFPNRTKYFDCFFPYIWHQNDQLLPLLNAAGGLTVLHREANEVAERLSEKYRIPVDGYRLSNWRDQPECLDFVKKSPHPMVFVSGGPAGKLFCTALAEVTQKVVIDAGHGMLTWMKP